MPKKIKLPFFDRRVKKFQYRFAQLDFILIMSLFLGIARANKNHSFTMCGKTSEPAHPQNTFTPELFYAQKNDKHWLETPLMQSPNHLPDMAEILQEVRQKAEHIFDKQMTLIGQRIWRTAAFKCKKKKHKFLSAFWKKTEKLVRVWFWYEIDRMNTFQKLGRFIYDSCFLVTIKWRLKKGMIWLKISSGKIFFFVHMTAYCKRYS